MTDLAEACRDLAAWLPALAPLIAEPDTDGTTSGGKPGSAPPWNSQAAAAFYDAHALVRDIEAEFRHAVTGRPAHRCRRRSGSDGNTLAALDAIARHATAVSEAAADDAARQLSHSVTVIMQLPAVDLAEVPQRIPAPCPRPGCGRPMLRYFPLKRVVVCVGCCVHAEVHVGAVSGDPILKWEDGVVT